MQIEFDQSFKQKIGALLATYANAASNARLSSSQNRIRVPLEGTSDTVLISLPVQGALNEYHRTSRGGGSDVDIFTI